jgi:hypothetical protein
MENRGITYPELLAPTPAQISSVDPDLRDLYIDFHESKAAKLLSQVTDERSRILDSKDRQISPPRSASSPGILAKTLEAKQLQRITRQQHREIEALVETVLRSEQMRVDSAMKAARAQDVRFEAMRKQAARTQFLQERHLQKQREHEAAEAVLERKRQERVRFEFERERQRLNTLHRLEEAKRRTLHAQELARMDRADRNRIALERIEMERARKLHEKALQDEQRALALLIQQQEENERRRQHNREEMVRKKKVLDGIRTQEKDKMTQLKSECETDDFHRQVFMDKLHERQTRNRGEAHEREEAKVERYRQQKERIDEETAQMRQQSLLNDEIARDRLRALQEQKERERKRFAYSLQLKKEERDMNAAHLERMKNLKIRRENERILHNQQRFELLTSHRERMRQERREQARRLEKEKEELTAGFQERIWNGNASPEVILRVAQQHGIDVSEMEKKIGRPTTAPV